MAANSFRSATRHRHRDLVLSHDHTPRPFAANAKRRHEPQVQIDVRQEADAPVRALLVVAHPDDESECAALVYRITHELGGVVDQIVVTNGEGGHQYSALAEAYYRLPLNPDRDGQEALAGIRRDELIRAGRILGIRHHYFLDQKDTGPTLDPSAGLGDWDIATIRRQLQMLLGLEKYDLVLFLMPTPDTHGHHKTVAALALEALAGLETAERPAAVGVQTARTGTGQPENFSELEGYPLTRTTSPEPTWSFDRSTPLACHPAIEYSIVVNWVIAEHKSQGLFQMESGKRSHEHFWLFEAGGEAGSRRWREFLQLVGQTAAQEK